MDSLIKIEIWITYAITYSISVILLSSFVLFYLRALSSQEAKPKQHREKLQLYQHPGRMHLKSRQVLRGSIPVGDFKRTACREQNEKGVVGREISFRT